MPARIPAPLHRLALKLAHGLRLAWWSVRRPELHSCNVLVSDGDGRVLLVRHSYQAPNRWMLPGGGLARGERPEDAARRELLEEAGCRLADPVCFGVDTIDLVGARNHVHLVAATTADPPRVDGREVIEARFFGCDELPLEATAAARRRIARWLAIQSSGSCS